MSQDQKVTLTFNMSDGTDRPISFIVPGGIDGMLPQVALVTDGGMITPADFKTLIDNLLVNPGLPAQVTQIKHTQIIDGTEYIANVTQYPVADVGSYCYIDGWISNTVHRVGIYWLPIGSSPVKIFEHEVGDAVLAAVTQTIDSTTTDFLEVYDAYDAAFTDSRPASPQNHIWTALFDPGSQQAVSASLTVTPTTGGKYIDFFVQAGLRGLSQIKRYWVNDDGTKRYAIYDRDYTPPVIPPSETLKSRDTSGNFSFGYGDTPNDDNACGLYGTSVYLKMTITLSDAPNGNNNLAVIVRPDGLPCLENGTLVPYNMWADSVTVSGQNKPRVIIHLDCPTPPTHLINPATKVITKLQRAKGQTSGLSSIYPEAPDGETANEFHYVVQYFYTA